MKYRKRTIEYRIEGHTLEETSQTFKVSIPTNRKWEKQLKEKGTSEKKALVRGCKKLGLEKLKAYIEANSEEMLIKRK